MQGLLEKARTLRASLGLGTGGRDEIAFDPDSGITVEEQKEILAEIERVGRSSRLTVKPETFAVKAAKRGVLFPALVNAAAVMVLAIGLGVLYVMFQLGETKASQQPAAVITAEGKLLAEVKKESEAKLQEKNQQISDIEGRLAEIDRQRQDLQSSMDTKVQAKEAELRAALAAELDAEKARLEKQGLSAADIDRRLADLEAQKNAAFTKQLDAYKAQAESERRKSEAALQQLTVQFNSDLAKANAERQQVLTESRQREADLQAQLAAKTKELASAQAQTQAQLAALSSQKSQEDLVAQQLVGLYSVAQSDIAARNFSRALSSLQAIASYVSSADVASLPGMAKRRPVDLFIVDSLTALVKGEQEKASVDTASLVQAAGTIAEVRARTAEADAQLRAGRAAEAEKLYAQALAVIPDVAKSYAFFTQKAADAESARQASLRAALARAETAFAAGRSAESLDAYRDALGYLPETAARLDATMAAIEAGGAALASQKAAADQTRAAGSLLAQADAALAAGGWVEAVTAYLQVLQGAPRSDQAPLALQGIGRAVAGLDAKARADAKAQADAAAALGAQAADLQKSLAASADAAATLRRSLADSQAALASSQAAQEQTAGTLASVKKTIMSLLGQPGDPQAADTSTLMNSLSSTWAGMSKTAGTQSTLQSQLDASLKASRESEQKIASLAEENRKLQQSVQELQAKLKFAEAAGGSGGGNAPAATVMGADDAARLKRYDQLLESYRKYASQEGPVPTPSTTVDLRKTIGYREAFLQAAGGVFEQIAERMHVYDNGFLVTGVAQGRADTLKQVSAILVSLAKLTTAAERTAYLDRQLAAAKNDKALTDYLSRLKSLAPAQ